MRRRGIRYRMLHSETCTHSRCTVKQAQQWLHAGCHVLLALQAHLQSGECPEEVALLQELLHKTNDTEATRNQMSCIRYGRTQLPLYSAVSNDHHSLRALDFNRRHFSFPNNDSQRER